MSAEKAILLVSKYYIPRCFGAYCTSSEL